MPEILKILRHTQKLDELEEAVVWLRGLVDVPETSRFPAYVRVWRALVDASDLPNGGVSDTNVEKVIEEFGEMQFRGAVHEAYELAFIHQAFKNDGKTIPRELLDKIVKGRYSEIEENPAKQGTTYPRNFLFEMTVAARLKRDGIPVELTGDADVEFNFRMYRCFVECKRLGSKTGFDTNFRAATTQLKNRFEKFGLPKNRLGFRPLGMIFFAATKAVNPLQGYLQARSHDQANQTIDDEIFQMLSSSKSRVLRSLHPNISTLAFYTNVQLRWNQNFGSYLRWSVFPYHNMDSRFARAGKAIFDKLRLYEK